MRAKLIWLIDNKLVNKISVVIPARNEEKNLPTCINSLMIAAKAANIVLEIIVVLNRSTDKTEAIARELNAIIVSEDAPNLSKIRNEGVKKASSEIVVTVDADSRVSENMFQKILKTMSDRRNIGGGVLILPERWSLGIFCTGLMLLPIILYYRITGGLFFFRKEDFEEIGGFNENLVSVEDIDFAVRLKKLGKKTSRKYVNLMSAHIVTSMRKFDKFGDWYFVRNPKEFFTIFRGTNRQVADKIWYNFEQ